MSPIGKPVREVLNQVGGTAKEYGEIIMGGPFTGKRTTLQDPITKTTGGLIVTENFFENKDKMGILVCACGGDRQRLEQIAPKHDKRGCRCRILQAGQTKRQRLQMRKPRSLSRASGKNHQIQESRSEGGINKQLHRLHQYGDVLCAQSGDESLPLHRWCFAGGQPQANQTTTNLNI